VDTGVQTDQYFAPSIVREKIVDRPVVVHIPIEKVDLSVAPALPVLLSSLILCVVHVWPVNAAHGPINAQ